MFDDNSATTDSLMNPGTVVGNNVKLTGTIQDVNDIIIHGTVEGEIISDKMVTVSETAKVKGPIKAELVSVAGTVEGAILATEKLELLATGQIDGSISTKDLVIKSGAIFNGKCQMTTDGAAEALPVENSKPAKKDEPKAAKGDSKEAMPKESLPATAPTFELED